jgi:tRNA dimethylallyltransferase
MNLYCILGPTSSGKTDLSLQLARQLENCYIVNCDARQIYQGLNIGTGKISGVWESAEIKDEVINYYLAGGQKHLMLDYIPTGNIKREYSLYRFLSDYTNLIKQIQPKNIVLVGGTGWYARSVYKSIPISLVKPDKIDSYKALKRTLIQQKVASLHLIYGVLCAQNTCFNSSALLNDSDWLNPIRLQNHILNLVIKQKNWQHLLAQPSYEQVFKIALIPDQNELLDAITKRLTDRIALGLVQEVESLSETLNTADFDKLGLEYRLSNRYILGQLSELKWKEKLLIENLRYAKRQISWLRKHALEDNILIYQKASLALNKFLENLK